MVEIREEWKQFFSNKNVLVTGGNGSFGHQITDMLLELSPEKIILVSNDEAGLHQMEKEYEEAGEKLEFKFGDIRDQERMNELFSEADIIYHAAALKHVPPYESQPEEAIKTNVNGAKNVKKAAISNEVDKVIAISTDKAVEPINTMGMTKALQEKIFLGEKNREVVTDFNCVRYGNVVGSRGSVIPFFREKIDAGEPLPLTDKRMNRFLLTLEEAIDLVFHTTVHGEDRELFVRKMKSCQILDLAKLMAEEIKDVEEYPIKEVGIRPGEKLAEVLVSEEEMRRAIETKNYFKVLPHGSTKEANLKEDRKEYRSNKVERFTRKELKSLLDKEGWFDENYSTIT